MYAKASILLALLPLINAALWEGEQWACTNRAINDHAGYDAATQSLGSDLNVGGQVSPHKRILKTTGGGDANNPGALLAMCNYAQNSQGGSSAEVDYFNSIMDSRCGLYQSGWVYIPAWDKTYWRSTNPDDDVCGNL